MSDFLDRMATASRARLERAQSHRSEANLMAAARLAPAPTPLRLHPTFDLIAEIKARSPAEGALSPAAGGARPSERSEAYARGGAAALSVLTEPSEFLGSMEDLESVAAAAVLPVMRKDFLVHPYQVLEARAAGASGVLLIARMLPDAVFTEMRALALELGMFVLAEAFDSEDLERIGRLADRATDPAPGQPPLLVGVNTRDLTTLDVDPSRLARLAPALPEGCIAVAESGLVTDKDVAAAAALGYRLALVGSALMRSGDPTRTIKQMLRAGRGEGVA